MYLKEKSFGAISSLTSFLHEHAGKMLILEQEAREGVSNRAWEPIGSYHTEAEHMPTYFRVIKTIAGQHVNCY